MNRPVHLTKEQQQIAPLFDGAFVENKPIPFPDQAGTKAYSNLFYWAHLVANETAEFPLHPHEGFEIMTFVLKGSLEHFDTATKVYTPLDAGGVQVIQAGSGVQHSERIIKGTELFQIWFDPDFSKTLKKDAAYRDYQANKFQSEKKDGIERLSYLTDKGPIYFETQGIEIEKLNFDPGEYVEKLDAASIYSYYLLDGEIRINDELIKKDDFLVLSGDESVNYDIDHGAELFIIKSPYCVDYKRFIERY
jgi:redox-sensitive bicupin YhaK (pirin superfamily)